MHRNAREYNDWLFNTFSAYTLLYCCLSNKNLSYFLTLIVGMDLLLSIGDIESLSGGKLFCRLSLFALKGLPMIKADVELKRSLKTDEVVMLGRDETVDNSQLVGEVLLLV